jgi:hypothetical protein
MNDQTKPAPSGKLVPITALPDIAKLPVHPLAEEFPEADPSEFAGLVESIRRNGILVPLTLYEDVIDGEDVKRLTLLEGRHRRKAGLEAKRDWRVEDFQMFIGTRDEAEIYVYSVNSLRRHQTKEQKEQQVLRLLAKHPMWPSRKLATMVGVSHSTIVRLRKPKEDDGKLKALLRAWENAAVVDQEKFVETNRVDLLAMMRL